MGQSAESFESNAESLRNRWDDGVDTGATDRNRGLPKQIKPPFALSLREYTEEENAWWAGYAHGYDNPEDATCAGY